jgi:fructokinase
VLVVGEALIDIVVPNDGSPVVEHVGGSPANVALALGRLAKPNGSPTHIGSDETHRPAFGRQPLVRFRSALQNPGSASRLAHRLPVGTTAAALAVDAGDGAQRPHPLILA